MLFSHYTKLSLFIFYCRQEKTSAGLNHILAAFVVFLKTLAVNFRIRVCDLGDEILPTLLYIWTQHRLNDSLKEVIIELFQLQIYIHHPKGAKTQEKGIKEVFTVLNLLRFEFASSLKHAGLSLRSVFGRR